MKNTYLCLPENIYSQLQSHLLRARVEDSAFAYVKPSESKENYKFEFLDWYPVTEDDYESRSEFHLNLSEDTWANAIKHAHDLQASLVEFHSHLGFEPAAFSGSDFYGFDDFIPHIMWRLKNRPYLAVVVNKTSFDGLVWIKDPRTPQPLNGIIVGDQVLEPTNLSLKGYNSND